MFQGNFFFKFEFVVRVHRSKPLTKIPLITLFYEGELGCVQSDLCSVTLSSEDGLRWSFKIVHRTDQAALWRIFQQIKLRHPVGRRFPWKAVFRRTFCVAQLKISKSLKKSSTNFKKFKHSWGEEPHSLAGEGWETQFRRLDTVDRHSGTPSKYSNSFTVPLMVL
jgi:hypothetical protein